MEISTSVKATEAEVPPPPRIGQAKDGEREREREREEERDLGRRIIPPSLLIFMPHMQEEASSSPKPWRRADMIRRLSTSLEVPFEIIPWPELRGSSLTLAAAQVAVSLNSGQGINVRPVACHNRKGVREINLHSYRSAAPQILSWSWLPWATGGAAATAASYPKVIFDALRQREMFNFAASKLIPRARYFSFGPRLHVSLVALIQAS